jgi:hypothetical protein
MAEYHLAQVNIARMLAPLDSPQMRDFVDNLDRINALAEAAPGFVWRLMDDSGNATDLRPFEDDWLILNMSVWQDVDSLYQYTYYSEHVEVFRRRHEWFEVIKEPMMALWWVAAGNTPTVTEAAKRLDHLRQHGPTAQAFTFKKRFEPQKQ